MEPAVVHIRLDPATGNHNDGAPWAHHGPETRLGMPVVRLPAVLFAVCVRDVLLVTCACKIPA
jgi:hypothetical protein